MTLEQAKAAKDRAWQARNMAEAEAEAADRRFERALSKYRSAARLVIRLETDLRLLHQNDPANFHETIQTEARCQFCGHER